MTDLEQVINKYRLARQALRLRWRDRVSNQCYYRVPWTLAVAGARDTAAAVLARVDRNALTESGDLRSGPPSVGNVGTRRAASGGRPLTHRSAKL
ncbi:MAG TPA: hypothetical protein DEV93_04330 [Chloroflexi bacterium]|nr:hypothetical protein [Chloroflexota bacterium]